MTGHWNYSPWIILVTLITSRAFVLSLGIAPDPRFILNHWQVADLELLYRTPFETVWLFHAQPPLFNLVIASLARINGPDPQSIASSMLVLHITLTYIIANQIGAILQSLAVAKSVALAASCMYVLLPWVIYYENFPFYPHITLSLVSTFLYSLVRYRFTGQPRFLVLGGIALSLAAWTWAVFHPLVVTLLVAGAIAVSGHKAKSSAIAILFATLLFSALPTVKNMIVFGTPTASSWLGINATQTVGLDRQTAEKCSFVGVFSDIDSAIGLPQVPEVLYAARKSDGSRNANHMLFIERSSECLDAFKVALRRDLSGYVWGRMLALKRSHQLTPDVYYLAPLGWTDYPALNLLRVSEPARANLLILGIYASLLGATAFFAISSSQCWYFRIALALILYFELVTHALNGGEQERMRYTIDVAYFVTLVFTGSRLANALKVRQHRPV